MCVSILGNQWNLESIRRNGDSFSPLDVLKLALCWWSGELAVVILMLTESHDLAFARELAEEQHTKGYYFFFNSYYLQLLIVS